MRHINTSGMSKPSSWLKKSRRHTKRLKAQDDLNLRKSYITSHSGHWGLFKENFEELSNNRCWFTEAQEFISPFHIEHFRPKGRIDSIKKELKFSEQVREDWEIGYWWLAFNWKNYRLCCFEVNTSHKKNFFPLKHGSIVCTNPFENICDEMPVLIDPCRKEDVDLVTYNMWEVVPSVIYDKTPEEFERARVSIDIYGLNKIPKLVNARKVELNRCNRFLEKAEKFYKRYLDSKNDQDLSDFIEEVEELKYLIDYKNKEAQFPTMCKKRIESSGYEWVNSFIVL